MLKSIRNTMKKDRERVKVPRCVQDAVPVRSVWEDGVFQIARNKYSRSWLFTDINYDVLSDEERIETIKAYGALLNSFDSSATTKITINNRRFSRGDFEEKILLQMKGDELDAYRREYNEMLLAKAAGNNSIIQEKYITVSVHKNSIEEARTFFKRSGTELTARLSRLGCRCLELDGHERLKILHDFYRAGEEDHFEFSLKDSRKKGHSFKDYICPDGMELHHDHFKIGSRFGRVIFIKNVGAYLKDTLVAELTGLNQNMMLSIDVLPVPMEEAIKEAENRLLGVATNITNWQRKQNANNNFGAIVPYDMEQQLKESKEFLDDLTMRDQQMMLAVATLVHTADDKKQLDADTGTLQNIIQARHCQMGVLHFQQLDGLNTVLPAGHRKIDALRTFTTESLSAFIPFHVQEVSHDHGIYYGQNAISQNMIVADRRQLLNGNSFILGVSGSGKSFMAKSELINFVLATDADVIVIDPDREYIDFVKAFGGEVIEISASSANHINAMDINRYYGEKDPIAEKSQFVQSLCEQIITGNQFSRGQKSIIDRCVEHIYQPYRLRGYEGDPPTLDDFREDLLRQPEQEAHDLALELEIFTRGSLNTFAQQTNVNTTSRFISYDIHELGKQLMGVGILVVLDSILNRITRNRQEGKQTFIFIDEFYILFQHEYSGQFLATLWKRVRKYGAYCTGITQNLEEVLRSQTARLMLSNSEFIIMMNQAPTDRQELAKLLHISERQLSYITNVPEGHGLLKVGHTMVPFENHFPKNTELYRLMTTKPGERNT